MTTTTNYWVAGDTSRVLVVRDGDIAAALRDEGHRPMATVGLGPDDAPTSITEWIFPIDIFDQCCAGCGNEVTDPALTAENMVDGMHNTKTGETVMDNRVAVLSWHPNCLEESA